MGCRQDVAFKLGELGSSVHGCFCVLSCFTLSSLLPNCSHHLCRRENLLKSCGLMQHYRDCAHQQPVAEFQSPLPLPPYSGHPCTGEEQCYLWSGWNMAQKNRVESYNSQYCTIKQSSVWEEEYVFVFLPSALLYFSHHRKQNEDVCMSEKLEVAVRWNLSQTGLATAQ